MEAGLSQTRALSALLQRSLFADTLAPRAPAGKQRQMCGRLAGGSWGNPPSPPRFPQAPPLGAPPQPCAAWAPAAWVRGRWLGRSGHRAAVGAPGPGRGRGWHGAEREGGERDSAVGAPS